MEKTILPVVELWKKEISDHIEEYVPYQASQQLKQMAAFFSPGVFYYYVLNFQNLSMDYVHEGTKKILGIKPSELTITKLLNLLPSEELQSVEKKESLVTDFLFNFLSKEQIPDYKIVYFFKIKDIDGNLRTMIHQATTLTVSESGKVEHVLGIHTDVSHLKIAKNNYVSFISLGGGQSYFNIDPESGKFDPCKIAFSNDLQNILTKREIEILQFISEGLSSERISQQMHLSFNTVKTHRKNILRKSGCNNITELVAKSLAEGII